jgi:hypothetical protein
MCNKSLIKCDICTNEFSLYTFYKYIFYSNNYIYQFDCDCNKNNKCCCFLKADESLKFVCKDCYKKCNDKCPFCRKDNLEKGDLESVNELRLASETSEFVVIKDKKNWSNIFLKYSGLKNIRKGSLYCTNCFDCCIIINSFFQSIFLVLGWSIILYIIPFFICQKNEPVCSKCVIISLLHIVSGWTYFLRLFGSIPSSKFPIVALVWSLIESFIYFMAIANKRNCDTEISSLIIMLILFILFTVCFCSTGLDNYD